MSASHDFYEERLVLSRATELLKIEDEKGNVSRYLKMEFERQENYERIMKEGFEVLGHTVLIIQAMDEVRINFSVLFSREASTTGF